MIKMNGEDIIDATLFRNRGRHANHYCEPNLQYNTVQLAGSVYNLVSILALQDMKAGTEVLVDYGWKWTAVEDMVVCA